MNALPGSSDDQRSAGPLRYAQKVTFRGPVTLVRGETLPAVIVAYETYGELNAEGTNAVLICHALSGDSHVARHDEADDPGWWEIVVGPGKHVDTERFFVVCSNVLGGCRGSTGPGSVDPEHDESYGSRFPTVTVEDMVDVQKRLLDHLGVSRWHAVIGASLGALQTLAWGVRYPDLVDRALVIAGGPTLTAQGLAFDVVGRNAIIRDPQFHGGQYYAHGCDPDVGLAIARMLGHITYLSPESMATKFTADKYSPRDIDTDFEKRFSVGSYLAYQGDRFVERFDANSYIALTIAMDLFDLGDGDLEAAFAQSQCRWLLLSFASDWLFPSEQSRQMTEALLKAGRPVSHANVQSQGGHDAFLLPENLERYGGMIQAFLGPPEAAAEDAPPPAECVLVGPGLDIQHFLKLIGPGESVLDLGCGDGRVLGALAGHGCAGLVGVELDEAHVLTCLRRGFDVVHADLNQGLPMFGSARFDVVLLSQTLQSLVNTEAVVDEVLRVGRRGIVSFPNFGYRELRQRRLENGRFPRTDRGPLSLPWYECPSRRFFSLRDWEEFCAARGIRVERCIYLDTETNREVTDDPHLNADLVITTITRRS